MKPFSHLSGGLIWALLGLLAAAPVRSPACSVCGCSLSSDWSAQGYGMMPGLQASLRYEYYDNTDLRSGRHSMNRSSFGYPNNREVQRDTLNRNTWLGLDYVATPTWGTTVQVPYYDRFHRTIAAGDTEISKSKASGIGDVRIFGRYQKYDLSHSFGIQLGFQLPTGRFNQNFATGPQTGSLLDRGLQLGMGTTNILAEISYFRRPAVNWGCFIQAQLNQPLNYRDGFKPSPSLNLNGGIRYLNTSRVTPQLQVNVRWDGRERGPNADFDNSGDSVAYVSPGLTGELGQHVTAFAFVQLPIYQRVNGFQLEPRWLLSFGLDYTL